MKRSLTPTTLRTVRDTAWIAAVVLCLVATGSFIAGRSWALASMELAALFGIVTARSWITRADEYFDLRIAEATHRRDTAQAIYEETKHQIQTGRVNLRVDVSGERLH